ncbi:MAG: MurR/RpiR family transcriptional regulator [Clostridiaceae bacterium]
MEITNSSECIARLRSVYNMLSPKAAMVADYIFAHAEEVITISITELALKAGVSQFSVVNCVKTAGYKGYSDFKVALALGMNQSKTLLLGDNSDSDNPYDILIHTMRRKSQSLLDTLVLISESAFCRAVELVMSARRIELYGIGSSSHAAEYLEFHLRRMGYNTAFYRDPNYQVMSAAVLGPNDLAFGFSTSGETRSVVDAIHNARQNGCATVAVTSFAESSLVKQADCVLLTTYSNPEFFRATNNSVPEQVSVVSAMVLAIAHSNKEHAIENLARTTDIVEEAGQDSTEE